jgi:hypothetical protein
MTGIMPCKCSGACQADRTCARLPRFRALLDTAQDAQHPRIHGHIDACADHLGTMVVAMATWAREQDLTKADLIILTIEPPPREISPRRNRRRDCVQTSGIAFSVVHLGEPESMPADMRQTASDAPEQGPSVRRSGLCSDQLPRFGSLNVGVSGVRALMPPGGPMWVM